MVKIGNAAFFVGWIVGRMFQTLAVIFEWAQDGFRTGRDGEPLREPKPVPIDVVFPPAQPGTQMHAAVEAFVKRLRRDGNPYPGVTITHETVYQPPHRPNYSPASPESNTEPSRSDAGGIA